MKIFKKKLKNLATKTVKIFMLKITNRINTIFIENQDESVSLFFARYSQIIYDLLIK